MCCFGFPIKHISVYYHIQEKKHLQLLYFTQNIIHRTCHIKSNSSFQFSSLAWIIKHAWLITCWTCVMTPTRGHRCTISKQIFFGAILFIPEAIKCFEAAVTFSCRRRLVVSLFFPKNASRHQRQRLLHPPCLGRGLKKNLTGIVEVRHQMVKWLKDNKTWIPVRVIDSSLNNSWCMRWWKTL